MKAELVTIHEEGDVFYIALNSGTLLPYKIVNGVPTRQDQ